MKHILSLLLFFVPFFINAQQDILSYVVVSDIIIEGNNVTESSIIFKELTFEVGDTISKPEWEEEIRLSRENIRNTALFNFVDFECIEGVSKNEVKLKIKVTERWYWWFYPYVSYADRNLNAWYEADDIRRFSYGFDLEHRNFFGLKHSIRLTCIAGYNQNFGLSYDIPYLLEKYDLGLKAGAAYKRDKEAAYRTENNKVLYFNDENDFAKQNVSLFVEPYYRFGHRNKLFLNISYNDIYFHDSLSSLNPIFENHYEFFSLLMTFKNDYRDEQNYPLSGHYFEVMLEKIGLGVFETSPDVFYGKITADWYQPLRGRWYWASNVTLKMSNDYDAPYFLNQGLGYKNDYVRTYELYVIDAMNFALMKNNLKFAILDPVTRYLPFIKGERFGKIHFALYANIFFDCAYSWRMQTESASYLDNRFIYGTGVGIDFVTYYDKVIRFEYGINDMGETGLFIHFVAPI